MGVGGALLATTTLAVIMQVFDDDERPARSACGDGQFAGLRAGPLLGGALLDHFWWGSIFLINLPVALLGLLAVARLVPETKNPQGRRPTCSARCCPPWAWSASSTRSSPARTRLDGPQVLLPAAVGAAALTAFVPLGTAHHPPHARHGLLHRPALQRRRRRRAARRLRHGRLTVPAHPAPPTRPRLRRPAGRPAHRALALTIVALNLAVVGAKLLARSDRPQHRLGMTLLAGRSARSPSADRAPTPVRRHARRLLLMGAGIALAMPAMATPSCPPSRRQSRRGSGRAGHPDRIRRRTGRGDPRRRPRLPLRLPTAAASPAPAPRRGLGRRHHTRQTSRSTTRSPTR
ncbi:MFS transporter [Streptomyces sp. Tu 2975]|nr:MFS transporter [Streptomyces sp. Tu 2975]